MLRLWRCAMWVLVLLVAGAADVRAQQPLLSQFRPDLRVYPQFFTLAQGADGDLYIGGIDGVLRYDGGRWHWLPMPRPGAVRALAVDTERRVWTGGTDSFGYIERNGSGDEHYVDLSALFAADLQGRRFADVWRVLLVGDEVWFQALHDVFVVSRAGERLGYWHHDGRFGAIADVDGTVWMQWRGQGLKQRRGDGFEMLPGGEQFATALIYNLFPRGDGRVLVHDVAPSLWQWEAGRFVDLTTPELAASLTQSGLGTMVDAGHVVLAGADGQVRVVDVDRRSVERVRVSSNYLADVMQASDGSLLVLDISGVSRMDWPPRWRSHVESAAAINGVYTLNDIDGALYASTWNGAFRATLGVKGLEVEPLKLTHHEAWAFHRHDGQLLLADSRQLSIVAEGRARAVSGDDLYPRQFLDDPVDATLLWLGTEHGPALMQRDGDGYRLRHRDFSLGWLINSLVAFDGAIWVGSGERGAHRLARAGLDADAFAFQPVRNDIGLPAGAAEPVQFSLYGGHLYASLREGLFRYADGRFHADDVSGLDALLDEGELVSFREAPDGGGWAFSYHSVYRRGGDGRWSLSLLGGLHTGAIYDLLPRAGGEAWIGAETGLLQHRDAEVPLPAPATRPVQPRIAAARVLRAAGHSTSLPLNEPAVLQLDGGSLEFEFAYPRLDGVGVSEFQFSIDPAGREWSPWRNRASAAFFALPPGDYRLRLRARSRYGAAVEADPFAFTLVPRWYQRAWFWPLLVFTVGGVVALALIQRQRRKVRSLRELNRQLDALVHARTQELELANVQLRSLADSDGLTGLSNRRHFDLVFGQLMQRASERNEPVSLLLLDVDHFKHYNDQHGHQAGDDILRTLALAMRESVRPDTLVARYGGEEFAVLAPHCDAAQAHEIAQRIRTRLATRLGGVTVSSGIATRVGASGEDGGVLIARADAALYRAKHNGRDRIETDSAALA